MTAMIGLSPPSISKTLPSTPHPPHIPFHHLAIPILPSRCRSRSPIPTPTTSWTITVVNRKFEEVQSQISHNIEAQFDSFKLMMQAFLDKIDERFESPTESSEIALGNDYCNSAMADANATAELIGVNKLLQPKEIDGYKSITSRNYETKNKVLSVVKLFYSGTLFSPFGFLRTEF